MEFKGTKGEWSVNPIKQWNNGTQVYEINHGDDGEVVAESVYTLEDAKIMAASKELLEALQKIYELLDKEAKLGRYPEFLLQENGGEGFRFMSKAIEKALTL